MFRGFDSPRRIVQARGWVSTDDTVATSLLSTTLFSRLQTTPRPDVEQMIPSLGSGRRLARSKVLPSFPVRRALQTCALFGHPYTKPDRRTWRLVALFRTSQLSGLPVLSVPRPDSIIPRSTTSPSAECVNPISEPVVPVIVSKTQSLAGPK
jgi:hypothetical protein